MPRTKHALKLAGELLEDLEHDPEPCQALLLKSWRFAHLVGDRAVEDRMGRELLPTRD
jgi:hypothetical protein